MGRSRLLVQSPCLCRPKRGRTQTIVLFFAAKSKRSVGGLWQTPRSWRWACSGEMGSSKLRSFCSPESVPRLTALRHIALWNQACSTRRKTDTRKCQLAVGRIHFRHAQQGASRVHSALGRDGYRSRFWVCPPALHPMWHHASDTLYRRMESPLSRTLLARESKEDRRESWQSCPRKTEPIPRRLDRLDALQVEG